MRQIDFHIAISGICRCVPQNIANRFNWEVGPKHVCGKGVPEKVEATGTGALIHPRSIKRFNHDLGKIIVGPERLERSFMADKDIP